MSKHTPGPWIVNESTMRGTPGRPQRGCAVSLSVRPSNEQHQTVCVMGIRANGDNLQQAKSDAHLIAAAPELLEALEAFIKLNKESGFSSGLCDEDDGVDYASSPTQSKELTEAILNAKAAISKARAWV